ncbi:transcriptional regulator, GntR family [Reichenbachiella faecimaris]|uniref:Transcriptional regulator, GntR family n=1 Tax=Reichenbachiella faecimaris TaxID=692418 RepID=A0A1W2G639_REIFA|nr:GntR family transcriptional regulator [Reichenbachiella faecimaris]SMD31756.1 transcriptional regulator, GntR family [Reichenbachiella faecimaris]
MEFRDDQAIYLQIADHFCETILLEKWKPGDRIPSVREMAVSIEVNPNTVMRTFTYLQEKGIIYNKRGIGYFVSEDGKIKTNALRKEDFVTSELPRLFKAMDLLHLSIEDISKYYQQHLKETQKN